MEKHSCKNKCSKCSQMFEKLCAVDEKITKQNNRFCDILAEHKALLLELTRQNKAMTALKDIFPINSCESLKQLDDLLAIQPDIYVRHMKILLASNVSKNLHQILANNLVIKYNIDGTHGKNRLKDFQNVYTRLIEAISASEDDPEQKLRIAIHKEKKKSFRSPKSKGKENRASSEKSFSTAV